LKVINLSKRTIRQRSVAPHKRLEQAGLSPLLCRIFAARGIEDSEQCEMSLTGLLPPNQLKGCLRAASMLADAMESKYRILFVGDFDADGATSTALGVQALRAFGDSAVDFLVPNRFDFGYGLTPEIVAVAESMGPQLIITVDNGISSMEGVKAAKSLGWQVIITDHHLPGAALPEADVIVNPSQPGCEFPSKAIAGVGVVFYVMMALRAELRKRCWFENKQISEPNLAQLLDLVALGTVADVVLLDHNNRILVSQGINRIRAGYCRPGIAALLELAGRQSDQLVSADLGFVVGPRLNAAGRLEDMSLGIACLLADDPGVARKLAEQLEALNQERRAIDKEMQVDARLVLERLQNTDSDLPSALCLYDENWHQGVIGILASRIKERYHRPVIAFANSAEGELKGSARSIPGLHIRDCLDAVAKQHPELLTKFGGHAMAAGLSIRLDHFDAFCRAFQQQVAQSVNEEDLRVEIHTDGELHAVDLCMNCAEDLRHAAPWGQGFPEPCFEGIFTVENIRIVGERHFKMTLSDPRSGKLYDGIQFSADIRQNYRDWNQVCIVYRLDINEYMGRRRLQLLVDYLEPVN
jgi:single-stranded-DNA-specific exonuclease